MSALGRSLRDLGVKVDIGAGLEAALEVISEGNA
jgi:aspartate aminotransferase-like enzyme